MSTILTHDLRSGSKDYQRDKAHKSKWSNGLRTRSAIWDCEHNSFSSYEANEKRPAPVDTSRNYTNLRQAQHQRQIAKNNTMVKKAFRGNLAEAVEDAHLSDSSGIDSVDEMDAPELKDVMFSFDAPTGPSRGSDILSFAITQAVQRYENKETEKIVKTEYDLVLDARDDHESFHADDEDDFELINGSEFD